MPAASVADVLALLEVWGQDRYAGPPILAITFDDGQLDNYQNALPVLERNGVTASFYIPSQTLENTAPLWHDAMATSVASSLLFFCSLMGASVRLPSTVMLGYRLNC